MKKVSRLKAALIAVAFLICATAGFVSMNVMTSCRSDAQICLATCGTLCVGLPMGIAEAMNAEVNGLVVFPDVAIIIATMDAYMILALAGFEMAITQKVYEVTRNIIGWIDTFWWYNLRPALQSMTDQLNTFDTYQDENMGGMEDAEDANRVDTTLMEHDMDSHREQRPSEQVCVAGTVTGSMTRASTFRRSYEMAATAERAPRGANDTSAASGNPNYKNPATAQKADWQNYTTNYCDQNYNSGNSGCAASGALAGRDLDVTGEIFMKDTIDLKGTTDPNARQVVDDLLANISEPFSKEPVPAGALGSAQGQQAMLDGQAYKAKRQVVYDALYHIVSRRAPGAGTAGGADDEATYLGQIRQAAGLDPGYFSANPSHNEIMEVMMSERFRTGQYSIEQVDEPENNAREMVVQQAFQAMLLSDELDLLDRYGLVLAAQASAEVKQYKPRNSEAEYQPIR